MRVTLAPATEKNVRFVAEHLREEDDQELQTVTGGCDRIEALLLGWRASETAIIGCIDHEPAFIIGVTQDGTVWLLGTPAISRAALSVFRACTQIAEALLRQYPRLHNVVDLRNTLHVRWLKLLGFTFTEVVEVNGHQFQRFHMTRKESA